MRAEILCVGSELLLGQIVDTNAAYIATQLARIGVDVHRKQVVGDNLERIADCIRGAMSRAEVLVITGGLGPTTDDLTREAIAVALGVSLEHHPELEEGLREFFARRGLVPSDTTMRQAYLPRGADAIPNTTGTAPGVQALTTAGNLIFAVPGVPREMKAMLDLSIVPTLLERSEGQRSLIISRSLRAFGIGESSLSEPLEDILTTATNPTVAPLIYGNTEVHLRLTAKAPHEAEATTLLDSMEARIRERVGEHIFGIDDQSLPAVLLDLLASKGITLAVAESVTGGLINGFLTDIPGSSRVLLGGVVAYSNAAKESLLGVRRELIEQHGVVSSEVAAAMAEGARRALHSQYAIATTGEAGPNTATDATVGLVYIALCGESGTRVFERQYFGDRDAIRRRAALTALDLLRRHILGTLRDDA